MDEGYVPHGQRVVEPGAKPVSRDIQTQALDPWRWERLGGMRAEGTQVGGSPHSSICSLQGSGQLAEVMLDFPQ